MLDGKRDFVDFHDDQSASPEGRHNISELLARLNSLEKELGHFTFAKPFKKLPKERRAWAAATKGLRRIRCRDFEGVGCAQGCDVISTWLSALRMGQVSRLHAIRRCVFSAQRGAA